MHPVYTGGISMIRWATVLCTVWPNANTVKPHLRPPVCKDHLPIKTTLYRCPGVYFPCYWTCIQRSAVYTEPILLVPRVVFIYISFTERLSTIELGPFIRWPNAPKATHQCCTIKYCLIKSTVPSELRLIWCQSCTGFTLGLTRHAPAYISVYDHSPGGSIITQFSTQGSMLVGTAYSLPEIDRVKYSLL